jgi:hypothetical protein
VIETMDTHQFLNQPPIWSIFLLTALILILAFEAGVFLGKFI